MSFSEDDWVDENDLYYDDEYNNPPEEGYSSNEGDEDGWDTGSESPAAEDIVTKIDSTDYKRVGKQDKTAFSKFTRGIMGTATERAAGLMTEKYTAYENNIQEVIDTIENMTVEQISTLYIDALVPAILFYRRHMLGKKIDTTELKTFIKKNNLQHKPGSDSQPDISLTMIKYVRMLTLK